MFVQKVAVKCIIEEKGKVLLIKEGKRSSWRPGTWALPGGKMDEGENLLESLARELKEETGLKVRIKGLYRVEEIVAEVNYERRLVHHFVFIGDRLSGSLREPDDSVAEIKWISKKDLTAIKVNDLAEFYYPTLFEEYIKNPNKIIELSKVKIWDQKTNKKFSSWIKLTQ